MFALGLAVLIGVVHVHHEPSHDSDASFEDVLAGAREAGVDFVVLTEHAESPGPLPAREHVGVYPGQGGRALLVLAGAEIGTDAGHLLVLGVPSVPAWEDRPAADVIADVHAAGGFAVVPHPETHGGWSDWDAPFDGLEVQNTASDFTRLYGPLLPFRLIQRSYDRETALARLWVRPEAELARWERLLAAGRRVVAFAGTDAHQNQSLFGWQLDPYAQQFSGPRMVCEDGPLEAAHVWRVLREGRCVIRYANYGARAAEAVRVGFPSGRFELQLDGGRRVLEISNAPASVDPPASDSADPER